jgi:hypothetical protein
VAEVIKIGDMGTITILGFSIEIIYLIISLAIVIPVNVYFVIKTKPREKSYLDKFMEHHKIY